MKRHITELTQDEFNRLVGAKDAYRASTAISPKEKNDLYADIKDFEQEFRDLQDTAERLPDEYIDQVCATSSYPFDDVIDEVDSVEDWCDEAEEFLKSDINNWGLVREARLTPQEAKAIQQRRLGSSIEDLLKEFNMQVNKLSDDTIEFKFPSNSKKNPYWSLQYEPRFKSLYVNAYTDRDKDGYPSRGWGHDMSAEEAARIVHIPAYVINKLIAYASGEAETTQKQTKNMSFEELCDKYGLDPIFTDEGMEIEHRTASYYYPKDKLIFTNNKILYSKCNRDGNWETPKEEAADFAGRCIRVPQYVIDMLWNEAKSEGLYEASLTSTRRYAKARHDRTGAIRRSSGMPYFVHPDGVAQIVMVYGGTDAQIQAAYLHDTMEDTGETYEHLSELFGDDVADIVNEITNDPYEVRRVGKEAYISNELCNLSHDALLVKLSDMYYNQKDYPKPDQAARQIKNIRYLLANRTDLRDNEMDLIEDILSELI